MAPRSELSALLRSISDNVYFQPPASAQMKYPCILYKRDGENTQSADNDTYQRIDKYLITVMDYDPDGLREKVKQIPHCKFVRWFAADNLNHDIFSLFY